jgi:hypothetical protein
VYREGMQFSPSSQILESFIRQSVVVVLPGKAGLDETLRGQRLHGLDDLEIRNLFEIFMLRSVKVLLGYQDALYQQME